MVTLVASLVLLATWLVATFIAPVGIGLIHILLAAGVVLWIRWWALRPAT